MISKSKFTIVLSVLAVLLLLFQLFPSATLSNLVTNYHIQHAEEKFIKLKKEAKDELDFLLHQAAHSETNKKQLLFDQFQAKNNLISYFVVQNNQLLYWSDNTTPIDSTFWNQSLNEHLIQLENGWYYCIKKEKNDQIAIANILIQRNYRHNNNYLNNQFTLDQQISDNYNFTVDQSDKYSMKDENGKSLFSFETKDNNQIISLVVQYKTIAFFLLLIIIALVLIKAVKSEAKHIGTLLALLFLFRVLSVYFKWPSFLYLSELFSPKVFALNAFFPNLGDTIITIVLIFISSYILSYSLKKLKLEKWSFYISLSLLFAFAYFSTSMIRALVINSTISFDLNNLFSLNAYSYIGLLLIAMLFASVFLLAYPLLKKNKQSPIALLIGILIVGLINYALQYYIGERNITFINWPIILFIFLTYNQKLYQAHFNLSRSLLLIVFFGIVSSYILIHQSALKERRTMALIVQKLAEEKDPIAEYLFLHSMEEIKKDKDFKKLLPNYWLNADSINNYLKEKYFGSFWQAYQIQFTACSDKDTILVKPDNIETNCWKFFGDRITKEGQITEHPSLYLMQSEAGRISYLSKDKISCENGDYLLFTEFNNKRLNQNKGYPELLLDDKEISRLINLDNFSFAKYEDGQLVNTIGNYSYSSIMKMPKIKVGASQRIKVEEVTHLIYRPSSNTIILLTAKNNDLLSAFTAFSYLFSFLGLFFFISAVGFKYFPLRVRWKLQDFTTKIQLFIIFILLIAIGLFSVASTYYIKKQYDAKNKKNISEKIRSVLIEVNQKLGDENELSPAMQDYMTYILIRFSNVFYTDINLYSLKGDLIATSRPEIFDIGFKAPLMDPLAYQLMAVDQKQIFINQENIGKLNYLSAYVPFINNNSEVLAFLNLPYFAKQDELEEEISTFLVSSINIYVVIFSFALILSVFFANYISKPLQLLREKIAKVNFGSSNEIIQWEGNDEISSLVKEYNRMVVKLADSADMLARTERAGAWKEMAKQVAHEIKNPLTPMKLNIQQLQRASADHADNLEERIKKTSETLIQQIDALSNIAGEFSNFAKMPEAVKVKLDMIPILKNAISLYDESESGNIQLQSTIEKAYINADSDQLLRVFNNIIKNAIQAIDEDKKVEVDIKVEEDNNSYKIYFTDNGNGIAAEDYDRIFVPNFTTKGSGMGLGLSIVKNIVETSEGNISFESEWGKGSTFILQFPKVD